VPTARAASLCHCSLTRRGSPGVRTMTTETKAEPIAVSADAVITVDVLVWDEGWEFDHPSCILRPIVRFSPNGDSAERMVEDLAIDVATHTPLRPDAEHDVRGRVVVDRQYPLATLKRRWAESWRGKEFPRYRYTASRWQVRFYNDQDGELAFDYEQLPPSDPATVSPPPSSGVESR
jgi:hypothetical protein